jgi:hypothetical protein
MGFIRSSLLVIASVLLFIALLVGNIFLTLSLSLKYETIEPEIVGVVNDTVNDFDMNGFFQNLQPLMKIYAMINPEMAKEMDQDSGEKDTRETFETFKPLMKEYCSISGGIEFDMPIIEEKLKIPCDKIDLGYDAIIEYIVKDITQKLYYKKYNCKFIDCVASNPLVFLSEHAKNYWTSNFQLSLITIIILLILMFILSQNKSNFFILAGFIVIISGLPFMKLNSFIELIFSKINGIELELVKIKDVINIVLILFSKAHSVFLKTLIIGGIGIVIGIVLKFFKAGFKFNSLIKKITRKPKKDTVVEIKVKSDKKLEEKEPVKKEVEKIKQEKKKLLEKRKKIYKT